MGATRSVAVGLWLLLSLGFVASETMPKILAKEEDKVTLSSDSTQQYDTCVWISPTGEKCTLFHPDFRSSAQKCMDNAEASWANQYSASNCTLTIHSLSPSDHGIWIFELSTLGEEDSKVISQIKVEVARPATVAFGNDIHGTLDVYADKEKGLFCTADYGRPIGTFRWQLLDKSGEVAKVLEANDPPEERMDDQDFHTVTQSMRFTPTLDDAGRDLQCVYEQRDETTGQILFENNPKDLDEIELNVLFIEKPSQQPEKKQAKAGEDYTIQFEFGANPRPDPIHVKWIVLTKSNQIEMQLSEEKYISNDRFYVHPMEESDSENNRYNTMLTIVNVTESDADASYTLRVDQFNAINEIIDSAKYRFELDVSAEGGGHPAADPSRDDGGSSPTIVVIVVVVLLIVIIVTAIGVTIWSRNNRKWCFAPKPTPVTPHKIESAKDPQETHPFTQPDAPNAHQLPPQVLKDEFKR